MVPINVLAGLWVKPQVVLTASSKSKPVSGCLVCPCPGTIAQEPAWIARGYVMRIAFGSDSFAVSCVVDE